MMHVHEYMSRNMHMQSFSGPFRNVYPWQIVENACA